MASRLSQNGAPRECVNDGLGGQSWFTCGNTPKRGSIAQRSRRPQREIGVGGRMHLSEDRWLTCGNTPRGESIAQRSRRPQREIGLVDACTWVKIVGSRAGTRQSGKHRTEVTEAGEGVWGWGKKA